MGRKCINDCFSPKSKNYMLQHVISSPSSSLEQVLTRKVNKVSHSTSILFSRSSCGAISCACVRVSVCHVFFSLMLLLVIPILVVSAAPLFKCMCECVIVSFLLHAVDCHWHQGAAFFVDFGLAFVRVRVWLCVCPRCVVTAAQLSNSFKTHACARVKDGQTNKQTNRPSCRDAWTHLNYFR